MSRRASLPGASELFRRTSNPVFGDGAVTPAVPPAQSTAPETESVTPPAASAESAPDAAVSGGSASEPADGQTSAGAAPAAAGTKKDTAESARGRGLSKAAAGRRGSGRQKHDTKITVYLSGDELLAIEQTRLTLRAAHELPVDRGRIVREAIAVLLADFEDHGADSVLVSRLQDGDLDGPEAAN